MHGSRSDCLYVEMQIELKCEYKSLTMREKMGFEVYGIICEILASYVFSVIYLTRIRIEMIWKLIPIYYKLYLFVKFPALVKSKFPFHKSINNIFRKNLT